MFGWHSDHEDGSKPDIGLFASDILPRHCCFKRHSSSGPTVLCPFQDAVVTRNGEVLRTGVHLKPGDVIGLGQRYLFLFKDPLALAYKVSDTGQHEWKQIVHEQGIHCVFFLIPQEFLETDQRNTKKNRLCLNENYSFLGNEGCKRCCLWAQRDGCPLDPESYHFWLHYKPYRRHDPLQHLRHNLHWPPGFKQQTVPNEKPSPFKVAREPQRYSDIWAWHRGTHYQEDHCHGK